MIKFKSVYLHDKQNWCKPQFCYDSTLHSSLFSVFGRVAQERLCSLTVKTQHPVTSTKVCCITKTQKEETRKKHLESDYTELTSRATVLRPLKWPVEIQLVAFMRLHFEPLRKSSQRKEFHIKKKKNHIIFCLSVPKYLNICQKNGA